MEGETACLSLHPLPINRRFDETHATQVTLIGIKQAVIEMIYRKAARWRTEARLER